VDLDGELFESILVADYLLTKAIFLNGRFFRYTASY